MRVVLETLVVPDESIPVAELPDEPVFRYVRQGLQRTSTAVPAEVFGLVARMAGLSPLDVTAQREARTTAGVSRLEAIAGELDPRRREVVSHRIERGPIGGLVKERLGGRCQVCMALGCNPIAFREANGKPFAEAHHVVPVSRLASGSLAATNVMVLCPNHHRQAHHGRFEILGDDHSEWIVRVDGQELVIRKTEL